MNRPVKSLLMNMYIKNYIDVHQDVYQVCKFIFISLEESIVKSIIIASDIDSKSFFLHKQVKYASPHYLSFKEMNE